MKIIMLAIAVSLVLMACGTPLQYIPQSGASLPASHGLPADIQVFSGEPGRAYEVLGFINWDYYQPGWRAPSITDILPQLQKKAWESGGDALIIRKTETGEMHTRNLRVIAEVIRWR